MSQCMFVSLYLITEENILKKRILFLNNELLNLVILST